MTILEIQKRAYEISKAKGWYENTINIPEKLALIHSEASEALDAYRNYEDEHLGEELADIVIRTLDLASYLGINMQDQILAKMERNEKREFRHGGKRC
mgnify:CR=1 FL=1